MNQNECSRWGRICNKISEVQSDRYGGAFPKEEFARHNIRMKYTERNRSQIYSEVLPMLNTGRVELPPDNVLINQLAGLERRTGRGADIIDHALGAHDDLCNAASGLAVHMRTNDRKFTPIKFTFSN